MKTYKSDLPEITLKYKKGGSKKVKITSSFDCFDVLMEFYDQDTIELNESVIVLYLNNANTTLGWQKHSSGGMCQTVIDVRMIMVTALQCGASSLILSHNHPSGQLRASDEDVKITQKVKQAGQTLGIKLLDHIIVSPERQYYSFADEGTL
jgi:DNA repair protein RadC